MRAIRTMATVIATSALVSVAALATPAGATEVTTVAIKGGYTSFVTAPGLADALISNGITPSPTGAGKATVVSIKQGGTAVRFAFPITGGNSSVDLGSNGDVAGGVINHIGGIKFANSANGNSAEVGDFRIDLATGQLVATSLRVNGAAATAVSLPVFNLVVTDATPKIANGRARVVAVGLKLTADAAGALNSVLGTSIFSADLMVGTASVRARL